MNKVKLIKEYLKKIDYSIKNGDANDQYNLQNEIIGVYVGEIDKLTHNLNTYHTIHCTKDQLTQDLFLLKSKLENYIGTLKYNHQGGFGRDGAAVAGKHFLRREGFRMSADAEGPVAFVGCSCG